MSAYCLAHGTHCRHNDEDNYVHHIAGTDEDADAMENEMEAGWLA